MQRNISGRSVLAAVLLLWLGPAAFILIKSATITTRKLPHPNPSVYAFHASLEQVRDAIGKYGRRLTLGCTVDEQDLAIDTTGTDRTDLSQLHLLKSDVYFWLGSPLGYRAEYALVYRPLGESITEVRVETSKSEVRIGPSFAAHGGDLYRPVPPTTVEEYRLLRTLGCILAEPGMPPVRVP